MVEDSTFRRPLRALLGPRRSIAARRSSAAPRSGAGVVVAAPSRVEPAVAARRESAPDSAAGVIGKTAPATDDGCDVDALFCIIELDIATRRRSAPGSAVADVMAPAASRLRRRVSNGEDDHDVAMPAPGGRSLERTTTTSNSLRGSGIQKRTKIGRD